MKLTPPLNPYPTIPGVLEVPRYVESSSYVDRISNVIGWNAEIRVYHDAIVLAWNEGYLSGLKDAAEKYLAEEA